MKEASIAQSSTKQQAANITRRSDNAWSSLDISLDRRTNGDKELESAASPVVSQIFELDRKPDLAAKLLQSAYTKFGVASSSRPRRPVAVTLAVHSCAFDGSLWKFSVIPIG
jgi:hypothetical protein